MIKHLIAAAPIAFSALAVSVGVASATTGEGHAGAHTAAAVQHEAAAAHDAAVIRQDITNFLFGRPRAPIAAPVAPEPPASMGPLARKIIDAFNTFIYDHPAPNRPWLPETP
ncbi:hypothetical protein [Mycolicibacterium sphagni]|uniref:hypothetical protein n=1 Tax=Mycolicibacterium sphagni TaxID=1786 RepID=UPI0021F2A7F9|nr:hypothetical protein [Mycolicibacterium sphagni]MCV7174805.1 hypothetical protein [Mycolicibacterium sphagni]